MKWHPLLFWLGNGSFLFCLWAFEPTLAQIVPDATMPVNSIVTPLNPPATGGGNTPLNPQGGGRSFVIEGGTRAGGNLFHSFIEFSVPTGGEAFFNNALDVQNIFSRVTGRSISNIDGLIRTLGTANLFLLNPNGIIFGPNARLNIGGSFLASTANSFKFADGVEFSATNPQGTPLLSINVPIGLQYGKNPGEIRVQGNGQELGLGGATESFKSELNPLEVTPGKNLTIVGGNVIIDGGILQAPGGRVEIGGIAVEGTVGINADGSLSFPEGVGRADVSISNKAGINVLASGGGSIEIKARNINILEESLLSGGIGANKESNRPAGNIILNATEAIGINSSRIENDVNQNAYGNTGNIEITAKSVSVTGGAQLQASTFGKGDAGSVKITASDVISFHGGDAISTVEEGAEGKGGGIEITAKSVSVTGGARLQASTSGKGDAGSVKITAEDVVSFDGRADRFSSAAISTVEEGGSGNGGGIEITAKSVSVTGGAQLSASTGGKGDAGSVKITASEIVSFDGGDAFSRVGEGGSGNGGGIEITAKSVSVTGGAQLDASTFGKGDAGSVKITAEDVVSFDGRADGFSSAAFSTVEEGAEGKGGGIEITAKSVSVTGGARLSASTGGKGDAGSVKITAEDVVSFDGRADGFSSAARSTVEEGGSGNGGGIEITAKSVSVTGGARLSASTVGKGDAGSVKITAEDVVSFDGGDAFSRVGEGGSGNGGGIEITAKSVSVTGGAQLDASTFGKGDAGSVKITAKDIVSFDGRADEFSSAAFSTVEEGAEGKGGDIEIKAGSLTISNGAELTATSAGNGSAGSIVVSAYSILLENQAFLFSDTTGGSGNIRLSAPAITLRGSSITTNATGGESGGNIELGSQFLQLRDGSRIATDASGTEVKGGNITINTDILAALENSDISANSINSLGGNVTINAQGIFGLQPRTAEELQSLLNTDDPTLLDPANLPTSDITATGANSALSGTLAINTPDVDPSSGLVNLPANPIDATALVVSTCRRRRDEQSEFIVTGRGGLPPSPNEPIRDEATWIDLRPRPLEESRGAGEQRSGGAGFRERQSNGERLVITEIVEATGWITAADGKVILTAKAPNATPQLPWITYPNCD